MIYCRPLDARLEDIGDQPYRTRLLGKSTPDAAERRAQLRAERVRVLGGHVTSTYSEVAAANQGTQQPHAVFLVTQDDLPTCVCVHVRARASGSFCFSAL